MSGKNGLAIVGLVFLLLLGVASAGCGTSDSVEASTGTKGQGNADSAETDAASDDEQADDAAVAGSKNNDDDEDKEEAVPVEVTMLERGPIESVLRFSSNLEAEDEVQVVSQAIRLARELLVEEGDQVRKDQVLLRLQDEEQRSQLAKVKSQLVRAEREFERQKRLFEQELISQQLFTDAKFDYEQLLISVSDAQRELSYTEVRAPIGGTVTQRLVKVGDQVQIGQHLFDIVDFDSMVARVFVPEKHLQQLRSGLTARISAAATGAKTFFGTVDRVSPIVDPRSGTVKVTVAVGAQEGLRPGLYVDVDLVTDEHSLAVLVPKQAVVYDADQMFVYRVGDERRVERVFIEAALADKDHVEPLQGLDAGDNVVIAGQAGLKHDALVSLPGDKDSEEESDEAVTNTAQKISG